MTYKIEEDRKKEIMENTDPSMDEMGTVHVGTTAGWGPMDLRMTRREAMLKGYMKKNGPALPWKSDKEAEEERRAKEQAENAAKEAEEKRIQEIMGNTDPSMDEMGTVYEGYRGAQIRMTRREAMLNGHMEKKASYAPWKSDKEAAEEEHPYTLDQIENALKNRRRGRE